MICKKKLKAISTQAISRIQRSRIKAIILFDRLHQCSLPSLGQQETLKLCLGTTQSKELTSQSTTQDSSRKVMDHLVGTWIQQRSSLWENKNSTKHPNLITLEKQQSQLRSRKRRRRQCLSKKNKKHLSKKISQSQRSNPNLQRRRDCNTGSTISFTNMKVVRPNV